MSINNFKKSDRPIPFESSFSKTYDLVPRCVTPNRGMKSNPSLQYSTSKSYNSAMKALQDKIRELEHVNSQLKETMKISEKSFEDKSNQIMGELGELRGENSLLKDNIMALSQEKEYLLKQIQQLNKEKDRHLEQNSFEREQWRKEKGQCLSEISEINKQTQEIVKERQIMIEELDESKSQLNELQQVLNKSKRDAESELKKLKNENSNLNEKIKKLKRDHDRELHEFCREVDKWKQKYRNEVLRNKSKVTNLKKTMESQKKEMEVIKNGQCKYALCVPNDINSSKIEDSKILREPSKGRKKPNTRSRSGSIEGRSSARSKSRKRSCSKARKHEFDTVPTKDESKESDNLICTIPLTQQDAQSQLMDRTFSVTSKGELEIGRAHV